MASALTAVLDAVTAKLSNRLELQQANSNLSVATGSEAALQTCGSRLDAAQPTVFNLDCAQDSHARDEPPQPAALGQKLVIVPIRKRSSRSASASAAHSAEAAPSFRQVQLPATPLPAGAAQSTPADKGPRPEEAELPANTPLAADVLAGLGLGALASAAADAAENGLPEGTPLLVRQPSGGSEAGRRSSDLDPAVHALAMPTEAHVDTGSAAMADGLLRTSSSATAAAVAAAAAGVYAAAGPVARPKATSAQDGARKGCNCKRSMCLKMYCECFAAGGYCAPGCSCANCYNHQDEALAVEQARQIVLAKDPEAFEKKVTAAEGHKKGCRCKRSKCLKKYCECYHAGAKCNPDVCQCEGCCNTEAPSAATAAVFASSVSLDADSMGVGPQPGPSVLHALVGILPPLQRQDTPEISLLADSVSLDNQASAVPPAALGPARQGSGRVMAGRAMSQQQQQGSRLMTAPTPLAFASLPMSAFQGSNSSTPALTAPFLVPGLFAGMPPFVFNPVPASLGPQVQLPPIQQLLLPIAPLNTSSLGGALAPAPLAEHRELPLSQGDEAGSQLGATLVGSGEPTPVASLGEHAPAADPAPQQLLQLPLAAAERVAAAERPNSTAAADVSGAGGAAGLAHELPALQQQGSVALTAHLSEVLGTLDPDIRDTASSPAPHVAVSRLPGALPAAAATLTGRGGHTLKGPKALRPPAAPRSRASSEERSVGSSLASQSGAGVANAASGAESSLLGKRPRRAASGGVQGAVAAEAAAWGQEWTSPPKRAGSMPPGALGQRTKPATGRFALLKKALEAETLQAQKRARGCAAALAGCEGGSVAADEEDVITALFELSSSVC